MSDAKVFRVRNYYEQHIEIDDGVEGESTRLPVRIRRFTVAQLQEFQRGFARVMRPASERQIYRLPDGPEQEMVDEIVDEVGKDGAVTQKPKSRYRIPDAEIRRRRLQEMTAAERGTFDQLEEAETQDCNAFCCQVITDHVWLAPNVTLLVENEDGSERTAKTGKDIVDIFGGNASLLVRFMLAIHNENVFTAEQKKVLRSLFASTPSSPALANAEEVDGQKPVGTVTPVGNAVSVGNAPAMDGREVSLSGLIET